MRQLAEECLSAYADALSARWANGGLPPPVGGLPEGDSRRAGTQRIAISCHLFYPDLLDEVIAMSARVPVPVDLFVTVIAPDVAAQVQGALETWAPGRATVRVVANRGRDVAPRFLAFPEIFSGAYDLVLFLHTKKSTNPVIGPMWRAHLFRALAGSEERVQQILAAFDQDGRLGVVAPEHFPPVRPWTGWNGNFARVLGLARRMGVRVQSWRPPDFPSGSMFWARPSALAPIVRLGLVAEDFPEEPAPPSGTTMHALERLVYVSAAAEGFSAATVPGPPLPEDLIRVSETPAPVMPGRAAPSATMRGRALLDAVSAVVREKLR